jgi:hypothetical protein
LEGLLPFLSPFDDEEELEPEEEVKWLEEDAFKKDDPAGEEVMSLPWSPGWLPVVADSLEKASSVSGKLGGVAGVFAGVIIYS